MEEDSVPDDQKTQRNVIKTLAWILGAGALVAAVLGVSALVDFRKTHSIVLRPTAAAGSSTTSRVVSMDELAAHDIPTDCWVTYHGQVFDMTWYP